MDFIRLTDENEHVIVVNITKIRLIKDPIDNVGCMLCFAGTDNVLRVGETKEEVYALIECMA